MLYKMNHKTTNTPHPRLTAVATEKSTHSPNTIFSRTEADLVSLISLDNAIDDNNEDTNTRARTTPKNTHCCVKTFNPSPLDCYGDTSERTLFR